jgi:hypothetical protein
MNFAIPFLFFSSCVAAAAAVAFSSFPSSSLIFSLAA